MKLKNPVTTILGVLQLVITLIAAIYPKLLGLDWANLETQQGIMAGATAIANGVFALVLIFKAGDKDGGV